VGPEVTADQDRASTVGHLGAKAVVAAHLEPIQDRLIGQAIEWVIARDEPRRAGRQRRPGPLDRPVRVQGVAGSLERLAEPSLATGADHRGQEAQQAQDRVTSRRAEAAQHGQQKVVEDELPAPDPAQSSLHERGPRSAAKDFKR
jgi:hypothetical protein